MTFIEFISPLKKSTQGNHYLCALYYLKNYLGKEAKRHYIPNYKLREVEDIILGENKDD